MKTITLHLSPRTLLRAFAALLLAGAASAAWSATAPAPFTARYQVLRNGESLGEATIRFQASGNGEYEYSNQTRGTSGLAALLGASSEETTRLRWRDGVPETLTYDYAMDAAIKQKHRHLAVDWAHQQVTVDEGKGPIRYDSVPGMVDRNTLALALGLALRGGAKQVVVPVGVKQRVEQQQYAVKGTESVTVPAGTFTAERVTRTDADKPSDAWYAPSKFPLPVKLAQAEGGHLTLLLVSFESP
ncbi:DUF3108 domain-containing protein [Dyella sp.]|jgi:hypothetical protein|uniref:DUF3108 domain-containing protein n=1 Tax=Dyella sp. TaxID=1869338 RepID=UPI002D791776|nr:DUF3108 domain-containing protein [Dyella sp.]HET6430697.1 DUF3108 domain-containing protein [Dyella sp.]